MGLLLGFMVNSLLGFQGDWLIAGIDINMLFGIKINQYVDGSELKHFFGVFMLLLGCGIFLGEVFYPV